MKVPLYTVGTLYLIPHRGKTYLTYFVLSSKPTALLWTGQTSAETQIGHHTCKKPRSRIKGILVLHQTLTKRPFSGPTNHIKGVKFVIVHSSVTFSSHKLLHFHMHSHTFCQPTVFSTFPHYFKLLAVCNSYCATERTVRSSKSWKRKRYFSS